MCETRAIRLLTAALVALLSLAFATGTLRASVPNRQTAQVEALYLAGLTAADLCLDGGEGMPGHGPACALCLAFAPPEAPRADLTGWQPVFRGLLPPPPVQPRAHRHDPGAPPRGPPFAVSTV